MMKNPKSKEGLDPRIDSMLHYYADYPTTGEDIRHSFNLSNLLSNLEFKFAKGRRRKGKERTKTNRTNRRMKEKGK